MLPIDQIVTIAIIFLIITLFLRSWWNERALVKQALNEFKSLQELSHVFSSQNQIIINTQTESQKSWLIDHLVLEHENEELVINKQAGRFLSKAPIGNIIPQPDLSRNKLTPALLTSIGVTGTFLGISLGLSDFNTANVGENSAMLLHSAASLLDGMKTAFYTSLAGLFLSSVIMIVLKNSAKKIKTAQNSLSNMLAKYLIEITAVTYLKNIPQQADQTDLLTAQVKSAEAMENLSSQFGAFIGDMKGMSKSLNGDSIADKISLAVSKTLTDDVTPVLNEFKTELELLRKIKEENQQELLQSLVSEIKTHLIEPVTEELAKTSAAVNASNVVSEKLNVNVENVLTKMSATVETIDQFQQSTMQKLQEFATSLQVILTSFKDETKGTMQSITAQVENVLKQSIQGMDHQRTAFETSAIKASQSFVDMGNSLDSALEKRSISEQQLFSNMEDRMQSLLDETKQSFSQQTDVLETTGLQASKLMIHAREELERGLGDIDTKITNMSSTVQSELESFRNQYQDNLSQFFTDQNNLMEDTLGKQRNNLVEVVDKFKTVFKEEYETRHNLLQELTAQHTQLQKSAQTIEKLAKAIGLSETAKMSELQDSARTIGMQVGELKKEYVQASKVFREITEQLPKAMDQYFKTANQSVEVFFKGFDDSASKIHNRLAQAADFLVDAKLQERLLAEEEALS
jgi:hypothetical protein